MILHRYLLRFTTFKLVQTMKSDGSSFGLLDIERRAKSMHLCFEQEVKAFTAEDALTQLRAAEGGSLGQPPFVFAIEPLADTETPLSDLQRRDAFYRSGILSSSDIEVEEEAKCHCGAVAVQWRKDTPVCAMHRNEDNDE